jgi:hypothetical protein
MPDLVPRTGTFENPRWAGQDTPMRQSDFYDMTLDDAEVAAAK